MAATVLIAAWFWRGWSRERSVREITTPEIERLIVTKGEYLKAAELTRRAQLVLPKDPVLDKLWTRATGNISISATPPGAEVSMRRYAGDANDWKMVGQTPVLKTRVPRDEYLWRVAKPGYVPTFFLAHPPSAQVPGFISSVDVTVKLRPNGSVPRGMVTVPEGGARPAYPLGPASGLPVDAFMIDEYEVTNEEYATFVKAGGYQNRALWKEPLTRDGRKLPWEQAVALFHDSTGRPGPSTWTAGTYPKGHERYPVAGVSWYEAAAYAEFVGKSLPTAFHWTLASQSANFTPLITPASNFGNEGTRPVGTGLGVSGFGTKDMAGNVKEWCLNEAPGGRRFILGGGFGEPEYMFQHTDAQSPWDRRPNFGFRCVKLDAPANAKLTATIEADQRDYSKEKPVSDPIFKAYSSLYAYDKVDLNAKVEAGNPTSLWTQETVTLDAAYGHERLVAYLFLPRTGTPPYQTVVYFPGAGAFEASRLEMASVEEAADFILKSGRTFIIPIYKGTYERRDGMRAGGKPPAFFRDHVIAWSKDLGRTIDYLETRKDIDSTRLAYFGNSLGGTQLGLLAMERRIRAAIVSSGGLQFRHDLPEVLPFSFIPHVTVPVLMLSGRYDGTFPIERSQRPFFRLLGTPPGDKKQVIYEGGHGVFPRPRAMIECLAWLDKYLGPVKR